MHETNRLRERAVQFRNAPGHRAGMPMLQHASGHQPERIDIVRRFGGGFIRERKNARLSVGVTVESQPFAGLYIGIMAFPKTPPCLIAVDYRPAQPAVFVIGVEGCEIVPMSTSEARIFLEQSLLY